MAKHSFSYLPSVKRRRTRIKLDHGIKTSMTAGYLYPLECTEVLPGDTWFAKVASVSRVSSAFIRPIMDNLFMDIHHFFVPIRLVDEDAEKVFGNPNPSQYTAGTLESIPHFSDLGSSIKSSGITITEGTVGDYLGLPIGTIDPDISVLPFRAFALIYNEWFRNENVLDEILVQKGDVKSSEVPNNNAWSANNYTGKLPKASKIKDIFTSCLPQPQKGIAPKVPIQQIAASRVFTTENPVFDLDENVGPALKFAKAGGALDSSDIGISDYFAGIVGFNDGTGEFDYDEIGGDTPFNPDGSGLAPINLAADFRGVGGIDVNDMRFAFQFQRMLELDARCGSRYNEYLLGHYGVNNPDARLQFTEYIGGGRIPINVQQVAQTTPAQSEDDTALAELGAFSLSGGFSKFSKSITEHGYIITVACIKQPHTYSQGIDKLWRRKERNDFYDPLYAHLGEQPIYASEIKAEFTPGVGGAEGTSNKDTVFGYNEYGVQYRYLPNRATGAMRPTGNGSLGDVWTLGDLFANAPTLSAAFVEENSENIDRTLAVPSSSMDNFIVDLFLKETAIRVMPLYSMPGLIDHTY